MKKEKKVRTYQRRTKSGKMVTVRAHTASYEAAEKAKEAAKKEGAGEEFSSKVKKGEEWKLPMDEFLKMLKEKRAKKREDEESKKVEDEKPKKKSEKTEKKTSTKKTTKKRTVGTGTNGPEPKNKTTTKKTAAKADTSEPAFTRDEFKEWYRGTGSDADKKVAKALRKQLGSSGYRKFEDEAINNYTSRGHLSMFKRVSGGSSASAKSAGSTKDTPKVKGDKLPSVGQKVSLKNWMGGKAQSYEVVGVQKATKAAKDESGLQNWLWVKDKKGNIHAATQEEDGRIGIDSTWTDFTDSKSHPYASSLRKAGYSLRKKSGSGGEYWDVVKTSSKSSVKAAPVSKPTLSKSMVTISKVPKSAKSKIIDYVESATDGEYASGKYTWKDTLAALRHPSESTVRERVERMYGVKVDGVKKKPYDYYNDGSKKRSVGTGTNGPESKKSSAVKVKKELARQKAYVKHLSRWSKDPAMKSYIAAESKILSDLKSYSGPIKTDMEIDNSTKALAKKHGLSYEGDGEFRDKKGGKYRISTSPITGISTLHPLTAKPIVKRRK